MGALARRRTPLCPRRTHPHRELLQVDAGRVCQPVARGRVCQPTALDGRTQLVRRVRRRCLNGLSGLQRAAAKPSRYVIARSRKEVAVARVAHARLRAVRSAAQHRPAVEPGRGVVAVGVGQEAGEGLEGAAGPFPHVAPAKGVRRAAGRAFPFGLGGQAAARPTAPRLGLVQAQVAGGLAKIQGAPGT
eukprot:gene19651-27829_t